MKTKLVLSVAALQVLVLVYLAAEREWVLHTGRTFYLRTAPIDPHDVMRGEYVQLNYDLSRVPRTMCRGRLIGENASFEKLARDTKVYAGLNLAENEVAEIVSLSTEPPPEALFLRGRTEASYGDYLQVRYGLEAYFLEQGKGAALEQARNRNGIQVPLEMKVAVNSRGLGVLKDYRWCALGMGVELETKEVASADGRHQRHIVAANIQVLNVSSNDLALVDLPGRRSLGLVPVGLGMETSWRWLHESEPQPAPNPDAVIMLKPNQTHSIRVAFDDPRWSVQKQEPSQAARQRALLLSDLQSAQDWSARFRFEYRPPARAACAQLPNANIIWHGKISSRAFNASGTID